LAPVARQGIETDMRTLKRPLMIWLAAGLSFGLILAAALVWSL